MIVTLKNQTRPYYSVGRIYSPEMEAPSRFFRSLLLKKRFSLSFSIATWSSKGTNFFKKKSSKGAKTTFGSRTNNCSYLEISENMRSDDIHHMHGIVLRVPVRFSCHGKALKTHAFMLTSFGAKISFLSSDNGRNK